MSNIPGGKMAKSRVVEEHRSRSFLESGDAHASPRLDLNMLLRRQKIQEKIERKKSFIMFSGIISFLFVVVLIFYL